ncbi:MAG: NUDIX domain-containing protein [Anaerolineaceae bacterium]|nr:NUDIX domain-containing protein [Anaerolineaceae bacterium]
MNIGTNGIVVDQHGNVLLIKRNDTRTFAPPGGALDAGELPPDGAAREVREETGLVVLPVRLVALTYLPLPPQGFLSFTFRCLLRGGEITTSDESPSVGFYRTNPLPRRISSFHRERLEKGLTHAGERPLFFQHRLSTFNKAARFVLRHIVYRWLDVKRKFNRLPPYQAPPIWEVATYLIYANKAGEYLWHRPHENAPWQLPGGLVSELQAPWETAVQLAHQQTGHTLQPQQLSDVYIGPQGNQLSLVFLASDTNQGPSGATNLSWFTPGQEPTNCHPHHCQMATNATLTNQPTLFHTLTRDA